MTRSPTADRFAFLTTVDHWSRQSPIPEVASSMSGQTVGQALDRVLPSTHALRSITVDHSTEFMSRALEDWAYRRGVDVLPELSSGLV